MHEDEKALAILPPDQEPRATDHIVQIIAMIEILMSKEFAYRADNGDVYFSVVRFPKYGELSKKKMDELLKDATTTESGLKYIILKEGNGENPKSGQTVSVHYAGYLVSGLKFDSSYDRGEPIEFPLGQGKVIPGWDEGISLLKVGGKATLIIPPHLAYGERGAGGVIPQMQH